MPPLERKIRAVSARRNQPSGAILIVEDHAIVLGALQASLQRLYPGVEQVCVSSGTAALEIIGRDWLRVFIDPDTAGVAEHQVIHEFVRLDLAHCCCLITTQARPAIQHQLLDLACISTRTRLEELDAALARSACASTSAQSDSRRHAVPFVTERHVELLRLLRQGLQNKAIARELGIAEGTVKNHLYSLMRRLGVRNRMQATQQAARYGL